MKILTAPSLFAANLAKIEEEVRRTEEAGADMIHFDIMDGVYVPNISFGFDMLKAVRKLTDLPIDAHMMTVHPEKYISTLADCGADIVTVHNDIAPAEEVRKMLEDINAHGMMAGIALKPGVPAEEVLPFISQADMVLVMTVEPGFSGQKFMDMSDKIRKITEYIGDSHISIEVDGGINSETAVVCAEAGANVFVMGSAAYAAPSMKEAVTNVHNAAQKVFTR